MKKIDLDDLSLETDTEDIDPFELLELACELLGWTVAIKDTDMQALMENKDIEGLVMGTPDYLKNILGEDFEVAETKTPPPGYEN